MVSSCAAALADAAGWDVTFAEAAGWDDEVV